MDDQIDDLDSVDITDAPTTEDVEKINKEMEIKETANRKVANRAALRKKIAQKKAMRTGQVHRQAKQAKENMDQIRTNPEMAQMMEMMMQGDNLNKLMESIPQAKVGDKAPNAAELKKVMAQMMGSQKKN
jgi:hypothetical protein